MKIQFLKNKKIIFIAAGTILILLAVLFTVNEVSKRTLKIAFYQIPDGTKEAMIKNIKPLESKPKFYTIDGSKPLSKKAFKKYSIIFTYNSKSLTEKSSLIKSVPEDTVSFLPSKIAASTKIENENYALPVLLDHFELAVYKTYRTQLNLKIPQTLKQLTSYLIAVNENASYPLLVIGADDNELWGFVSTFAESMFSSEQYEVLCKSLYEAQKTNQDIPYNLKLTLNEIKKLMHLGLMHPQWTQLTQKDAEYLLKDHRVGTLASTLSMHRKLPNVLTKYYEATIFPKDDTSSKFGVVCPQVCAVLTKNNLKTADGAAAVLHKLVSDDMQKNLSADTMLAPAASVGESVDSIADDIRFFAAAAPAGPLMTLSSASFTDPAQAHRYAEKIRAYLEQ